MVVDDDDDDTYTRIPYASQSCVCTSCSYEAELHNIDGFYKDFINLEFSFQ
jgi:hypothetical protein